MQAQIPSQLEIPTYVMNFPFTVNNNVINNPLMLPYKDQIYNYDKAYKQFLEFYWKVSREALVYLLPSKGNFQDQVFVANLGVYLPHKENVIIISNYTSKPRMGEEEVGIEFFESMGYRVFQPFSKLEGEADLKYIRENLYVGGYGIRTEQATYNWLSELFDMNILTVEMRDENLYHFDCMFLPLNKHKALVATSAIQASDLRKLEQELEIINVPLEHVYSGFTNCLVNNNKVYYMPDKSDERLRKDFEKLILSVGMEPVILNLSEFEKSGAGVSCFIMHLNYRGFDV